MRLEIHPKRTRHLLVVMVVGLLAAGLLAAPVATAASTRPGKVYFYMEGPAPGSSTLAAVARTVDSVIPATTSMQALLAGPTAGESSAVPGISTTIPAGTTLNSVTITAGVTTVDLSSHFDSGGGSASMIGRLAQVVYTLTQFPTVDGVVFEIDGVPTTVFGGEGVIVNVPAIRADFEGELPLLFIDSPPYGGKLGNRIATITGVANAFEATLQAAIYDGDGRELGRSVVMATAGNGIFGTFKARIPYIPGEGTAGSVMVWEFSAHDGSPINIREYPVTLGIGAHCAGVPATHVGTLGNDIMIGTPGDDVMVGFSGRDRIYGRGGNDRLCGNGGGDFLFGNAGDDVLYGGNGRDHLRGGRGFDEAHGGRRPDICFAEIAFSC